VFYNSTNWNEVIDAVLEGMALGTFPIGNLAHRPGKYVSAATVEVNQSGFGITAPSGHGDVFFANDGVYHGFSTKHPVTFIADGFDLFKIGTTAFAQGLTFEKFGISGKDSDEIMADTVYSAGAGIHIVKGNTIRIRDVQIQRKEKAIHSEIEGGFAWDNVIDVLTLENIYLNHNLYGIYQGGWLGNCRWRNIFGYINQKSLMWLNPSYDLTIENVYSNADGWNGTSKFTDSCISIGTPGNVKLRNIMVEGSYGAKRCPMPLIYLSPAKRGDAGPPFVEWCRAHIIIDNADLLSTDTDAITIYGSGGQVDINNLHVGRMGPAAIQSWYGGDGRIGGSAILNLSNPDDVIVNVRGGYVLSEQGKSNWFYGIKRGVIRDVTNWSPFGLNNAAPFNATQGVVGLYYESDSNNSFTPVASVDYTLVMTDQWFIVSGGIGVDISIKDPSGNVVKSGLTSLDEKLPTGYKVNFGAFSVAPTTCHVYAIN
jgi:hypothetical protein